MIALIDADILVYRVGYTTEAESEGIARVRTDEMIEGILAETGAKEFECWLSDARENNFRAQMYPAYKANRTQPAPKHYDTIKEHLVKEWGARFAYGMEADDALGMAQMASIHYDNPEVPFDLRTTICSIDKDLLQIPGLHYNFVKKEWQTIKEWDGLKWFYKQILIGDVSDNVPGCKGIGPVKAGKALDPILQDAGEIRLLETVFKTYQRQEKGWQEEEIIKHIRLVGSLLKIKQQEGEPSWDSLSCKLMEELKSSFTPQKVAGTTPSTEPISQATLNQDGSAFNGNQTVASCEMASLAA